MDKKLFADAEISAASNKISKWLDNLVVVKSSKGFWHPACDVWGGIDDGTKVFRFGTDDYSVKVDRALTCLGKHDWKCWYTLSKIAHNGKVTAGSYDITFCVGKDQPEGMMWVDLAIYNQFGKCTKGDAFELRDAPGHIRNLWNAIKDTINLHAIERR